MAELPLQPADALIVVDVQNDFCPGGALAVPDGDQVVPVLNRWIERAESIGAVVVHSRDWHPPDHCSFQGQGGPWPPHCEQDTTGAELHSMLHLPMDAVHVHKGAEAGREQYSCFDGTGLGRRLRTAGIERLFVGGLALDYCVKASVLDALHEGFETHLVLAATRAVNVEPGDGDRAVAEMEAAGAIIERALV